MKLINHRVSPSNLERIVTTLETVRQSTSWTELMAQYEGLETHVVVRLLHDRLFGELDPDPPEDVQLAHVMLRLVVNCNQEAFEASTYQTRYERLLHFTINELAKSDRRDPAIVAELRGYVEECAGQVFAQEVFSQTISTTYFDGHDVLFSDARSVIENRRKWADSLAGLFKALDETPIVWQAVWDRFGPEGKIRAGRMIDGIFDILGLNGTSPVN